VRWWGPMLSCSDLALPGPTFSEQGWAYPWGKGTHFKPGCLTELPETGPTPWEIVCRVDQ
jgi:hypothetical protein